MARRSFLLGWGLYGLLTISAVVGLIGNTRPDLVPSWLHRAAPYAFAAFLLLFAVLRIRAIRAKRYPFGGAFLQIAIGVLFLTLLFSGRPVYPRAGVRQLKPIESLLAHAEPSVRALACEVLRHRSDGKTHARAVVPLVRDPVAAVREEALRALRTFAGEDVGGSGPDAFERWRAWVDRTQAPKLAAPHQDADQADIPREAHPTPSLSPSGGEQP